MTEAGLKVVNWEHANIQFHRFVEGDGLCSNILHAASIISRDSGMEFIGTEGFSFLGLIKNGAFLPGVESGINNVMFVLENSRLPPDNRPMLRDLRRLVRRGSYWTEVAGVDFSKLTIDSSFALAMYGPE